MASRSTHYYQVLFESITSPLIAINSHGKIVDINSTYISTFIPGKLIAKEYINQDLSLIQSVIHSELFDFYQTVIQQKSNKVTATHLGIEGHGSRYLLSIKAFPVCVENEIIGMVFIHEDKTEIEYLKDALFKKSRQLNELQEVAGLGSWELDLSTEKADWTRKLYFLLGYEDQEVEAIPDNFLNRIHNDDKERVIKALNRPFEEEGAEYETEFRLVMPDGHIRHVAEHGQVIRDENNNPLRYVGTTLDITRRKKAEEELDKYREHLEDLVLERTKELEAFSHSLSHDLRAPLRSINGFCSVLYEDYNAILDDAGKDYLRRVLSSAIKMDDMIQGLLRVAKISKQSVEFEKINLSEMMHAVLSDHLINFPDRKVETIIQDNITVKSDRKMLLIVLQNLIENALKYSSNQPVTQIAFGEINDSPDDSPVFFIQDNGIGFDMKHANTIFETFKRLHKPDEFEGLGIGLSTVKKIIIHLNGRVWVESEKEKGSTFYFTLGNNIKA